MNLADLTWKDVEKYLKKRRDVLLPIGSVEEHGYHLPLSTDGDIATAVCSKLSRDTGILVAPVVWYGVSRSTRGYAGTSMVGKRELKNYVRGVLAGLKEGGFRKVYIVSGHFSRTHIGAVREAAKASGVRARILDFSRIDFSDALETRPLHACEAETSLMLYLYPGKVDMRRAVDEKIEFRGTKLRKTRSGVFGTPTKATRKKGERLFGRITEKLEEMICLH